MRAIIVDDEARSRRILKAFCEEYCPQVKVVGMANSVAEARVLIEEKSPNLVFLDIEMPRESGLVLMDTYEKPIPFEIIFTTAFEQYALQAIQSHAIDYLLKPIQIDQLIAAVEAVAERLVQKNSSAKLSLIKHLIESKVINKIALTTLDGFTFVSPSKIVRCEAFGNYTRVYFEDDSFLLLTRTLKHYEEKVLNRPDFFRIHKSHLINLNYVKRFIKGRKAYVEMKDASKIEVSERKRKSLLDVL